MVNVNIGKAAITPTIAASTISAGSQICHHCGAENAPFGFGPPLSPRGRELWACVHHRDQVAALLTPTMENREATLQPRML
jgi:hypothetical protein